MLCSCTFINDANVGLGIGEACQSDDDCQGSSCVEGVCTLECGSDGDCPDGSTCLPGGTCGVPSGEIGAACSDENPCGVGECVDGLCTKSCSSNADCPAPSECFGNLCQLPLSVGFLWVGVVEDEGWTLTHDQGRLFAESELPYLQTDFKTSVILAEDVDEAVEEYVNDGRQVIMANSFSLRDAIAEKASEHPDVQFLTCSANLTGDNLGSYFARSYQTWYLAGFAAAQKSSTNRLGFVGSFITPEVVRHINAFTLGAQRLKPNIEVEVRWEGFWFDLDPPNGQGDYRETVLTNELLETGCDVIAHNSDIGRTVVAVEEAHLMGEEVFSIGNDNIDACDRGPSSCIGVPYWNWGPQYVDILESIHKHTYDPLAIINDNVKVNPAESVTYFGMNDNVVSQDLKIGVGEVLADLAQEDGLGIAFEGPYCSTGQRDECVDSGQTIDDDELATMCWFVEGVIEKVDPDDPMSNDKPAQVPVGDVEIPPGSSIKPDCRLNQ